MATAFPTALQARSIASGNKAGKDLLQELMPVGAKMTYAAGLATIAATDVAVKVVAVTAAAGSSNGFTISTSNRITADFKGTRLCRVQGVFHVDIATGTDMTVLQIVKNGTTVLKETAAQNITAATDLYFEFNELVELSEDDYIELWAENEDAIVNVITNAYAGMVGASATPENGFLLVVG
jgi:L-lactate utilization protein LutC